MNWADFATGAVSPLFWAMFWSLAERRRLDRRYIRRMWIFVAISGVVINLLLGVFFPGLRSYAAGNAASATVAILWRWWDSGQRKRAAKLAGNKARAIRDKLTRKMPAPRKLAPVPG